MFQSGDRGQESIPWQVVCDQAASAMTVLDLEGRFLYVNRALCRLLGYDRDEIVHRHRHAFIHPDDRVGLNMIGDVLESACRMSPCNKSYVGSTRHEGLHRIIPTSRGESSSVVAR